MLLEHAVRVLTAERKQSRILKESFVRRLWDYVFDDYLLKYKIAQSVDDSYLENWCEFANSVYSGKLPNQLRVVYLCGPEPENDLSILLDLGLRIENIWAIESDGKFYSAALLKAHEKYPSLKIFNGTIESFFEINPSTYDIVYLDFTAPLFSREKVPFITVQKIFDLQVLSELGVLIVNTCEPDKNDETCDFLTNYFYKQKFIEGGVIGAKTDSGDPVDWFIEGPIAYSLDFRMLKKKIEDNFEYAYSAFQTQYPIMYSNLVQPMFRVLKTTSAHRIFFNQDANLVKEALNRLRGDHTLDEDFIGGDLFSNPNEYPVQGFLSGLEIDHQSRLAQHWIKHYSNNYKEKYSRMDAVRMGDLLRSAMEGYWSILSPKLIETMNNVYKALPDHNGGLFCDVPLPRLWLEVALNQLGYVHHQQLDKHLRLSYKARERKMVADLFVFDRCRAFYDWLPMVDLYGKDLQVLERQMLSRICLNAIGRQRRYIVPQQYFATALIGYGERRWINEASLASRIHLEEDD